MHRHRDCSVTWKTWRMACESWHLGMEVEGVLLVWADCWDQVARKGTTSKAVYARPAVPTFAQM